MERRLHLFNLVEMLLELDFTQWRRLDVSHIGITIGV
jgi:hypothetical protein